MSFQIGQCLDLRFLASRARTVRKNVCCVSHPHPPVYHILLEQRPHINTPGPHKKRRRRCDDGGRDWGDAAPVMPEAGGKGGSSLESSESRAHRHLGFGLLASGITRKYTSLVWSHAVLVPCHCSPSQLIQGFRYNAAIRQSCRRALNTGIYRSTNLLARIPKDIGIQVLGAVIN